MTSTHDSVHGLEIAVVGMACRFPGARDVASFWSLLHRGSEQVRFFSDEELSAEGAPSFLLKNPQFVKAGTVLDDIDLFDAAFFGIIPREAEIMDPQHRLFLQCAWEAMESSGYHGDAFRGSIGVFAGAGMNTYALNNLYPHPRLVAEVGAYKINISNSWEYLATLISYKLNLRGPSINVQTACSTSLVAVHLGCQSLLTGECDLALAGGVQVGSERKSGYLFQEGMIHSPDGHCRAFDAEARGTLPGNGLGAVVLRRLADALEDGDPIRAVIKGSALNNDGSTKVGFTAPSERGQERVILEAMAATGVRAESIRFVEAHGTGTPLGDPIETAALTRAFRQTTQRKAFCALGSVKTNFGHLGAAAGVAGLIKLVLALENRQIPPSLHFQKPNPKCNLESSPFFVNSKLTDWPETANQPRRGAVSSFGIGGTNAHAIVEESPPRKPRRGEGRPGYLILSAKSETALEALTARLAIQLREHPELDLGDVAHTLRVGRGQFEHRRVVRCLNMDEAIAGLGKSPAHGVVTTFREKRPRIAYLFPGQGAQYSGMAADLYRSEPIFRKDIDRCCQVLQPLLEVDLREILFHTAESPSGKNAIHQTLYAQPAIFVVNWALANLWGFWGIRPHYMLGHSIGEYVAACRAGVFSLDEALALVAFRAEAMARLPRGSMMAVALSDVDLMPLMGGALDLAAVNGKESTVVSGPPEPLAVLHRRLAGNGIACKKLAVSHAFHSAMMDPILDAFREQCARIRLKPPRIPFLSNVTGTWIKPEEAMDPEYWVRHLRGPVNFEKCLATLFKDGSPVLLEVGPGVSLSTLARRHPLKPKGVAVLSTLVPRSRGRVPTNQLVEPLHQLWLEGAVVNWAAYDGRRRHYRVPLPSYPFEAKRFWVEPPGLKPPAKPVAKAPLASADPSGWFFAPYWERDPQETPLCKDAESEGSALILGDPDGLGRALLDRLESRGQEVTLVLPGTKFGGVGPGKYEINPVSRDDYHALFSTLQTLPTQIFHLWNVSKQATPTPMEALENGMELGFFSLTSMAQALGMHGVDENDPITIFIVANDLFEVTGQEKIHPHKALPLGPAHVIPLEYAGIQTRVIDLPLDGYPTLPADRLAFESAVPGKERVVAHRGLFRWLLRFKKVSLPPPVEGTSRIRAGGVYLITGGLGGLGFAFARHLVDAGAATLILVGRTDLSEPKEGLKQEDRSNLEDKIRKVALLEKLGAEVCVMAADAGDPEQLGSVVQEVFARYGRLHGVIHAAGLAGGGLIQTTTRPFALDQMRAKLRGAVVLDALLADTPLDFFVLCSSLAAIMGNIGQVAYCAANAYLDAFAIYRTRRRGRTTTAINWDAWREVGMAVKANGPNQADGISTRDGLACFSSILAGNYSLVQVSTRDFVSRLDRRRSQKALALHGGVLQAQETQRATANRPKLGVPYEEPANPVERAIAQIFQQALGIEPIGANDDFFELEGDSLLGTQVLARMSQSLKVVLPMSSLFENPTPRGLARAIETRSPSPAENRKPARTEATQIMEPEMGQTPPLKTVPRDQAIPLSFAQSRLWMLDQLRGPNPTYNMASTFRLQGGLNVWALDHAIRQLSLRHEALRTTFAMERGGPVQLVKPKPLSPGVIDLTGVPSAQRTDMAQDTVARAVNLPFDLQKGPLFKVFLLQLDPADHIMAMNMHHIISDAWSITILVRELTANYQALQRAHPVRLPKLPFQYADFAVWQRNWLEGDSLEQLHRYWRTQLAGVSGLQKLPLARPEPDRVRQEAASLGFVFDQDLYEAVKAGCSEQGVTLFMYLLAAFQCLIHLHTAEEDLVVGTDIANRNHAGLENMVGFFVNQLVLRAQISRDAPFREFLGQVKSVTLGAFAHQDMPFDKLVELLKPIRDPQRPPLFRIKFVLQNAPLPDSNLEHVQLQPMPVATGMAEYDLQVNMGETGANLAGSFVFKTDYYDQATIRRLIRHFEFVLGQSAKDPSIRIREFPALLRAADQARERRQIQGLGRKNHRFGKALKRPLEPHFNPISNEGK